MENTEHTAEKGLLRHSLDPTDLPEPIEKDALSLAEVVHVLATHELIGKSAPALPDHDCRFVPTGDPWTCRCSRIVVGCTGCDWITEADGTQAEAHRQHQAEQIVTRVLPPAECSCAFLGEHRVSTRAGCPVHERPTPPGVGK